MFAGGPLADDRGIYPAYAAPRLRRSIQISPNTMITHLEKTCWKQLGTGTTGRRWWRWVMPAGKRASWSREVLENAWLTIEANTDILFRTPIAGVGARRGLLGIDIRSIANHAGHA
ncbi:hypothetical protein M8494_27185 [Serratia ureilytica]